MTTTTLTPVTAERDLFGTELATRPTGGMITPIMSKTDASKQLGRKVTFDFKTLSEFKAVLQSSGLTAAEKKAKRQQFLSGDAVQQRQMLGLAALQAAYQADDMAPMGRVPDSLELRKNGTLKLVSVESFIGKAKTETPTQKIARLERELREAKSAKADAAAPEAETVPSDTLVIE